MTASWGELQEQDEQLSPLIEMGKQRDNPYYKIHEGVLYQKVQDQYVPVAPTILRKRLIHQYHGPPLQGHLGPERTYEKMRKQVFWSGMKKDIALFIKQCYACQKHKSGHLRVPLQKHFIPPTAFHTISMDVVGPIPPSPFGEKYILVIQDVLTRWVEFAPMKNQETQTIVNCLMTSWITRYGVPQRILTDQGANFLGGLAQAFYRAFGIKKVNTTAYRPESNGANERSHREMRNFFSVYLDGYNKSQWRFLLNDARYVYNTAFNSALQMSPYEAVFALTPSLGLLGIPYKEANGNDSFEKFYGMHRREVVKRRKLIQQNLEQAQIRAQKGRNRHSHEIPFKIGDWVMVKNNNPKTKWDQKFAGPYEIVDQFSPVTFDIEFEEGRKAIHAVYLKPYYGPIPPEGEGPPAPNIEEISEDDERKNYWIPPNRHRKGPNTSDHDTAQNSVGLDHQDLDSESEQEEDDNASLNAPLVQGPNNGTANRLPGAMSRRGSPFKTVKRLFKRSEGRTIQYPPSNLSERPKRNIRPPDFYHNEN